MKRVPLRYIFIFLFITAAAYAQEAPTPQPQAASGEDSAPEPNTGKMIAVTINGLPIWNPAMHDEAEQSAVFRHVLAALDQFKAKAAGFVIGSRVQEYHKPLLEEFVGRGHTLGHQTFSYKSAHWIPLTEFCMDLSAGQAAVIQTAKSAKFFRFPFLHYGSTKQEKRALAQYLRDRDITAVPATVILNDAEYDKQYSLALKHGDTQKAVKTGDEYLEHVKRQTEHYEIRAQETAGREVRHILAIHMTKLNADFLPQILSWLRSRGYNFTSIQTALRDPIYAWDDPFYGEAGVSWLDRLITGPNEFAPE